MAGSVLVQGRKPREAPQFPVPVIPVGTVTPSSIGSEYPVKCTYNNRTRLLDEDAQRRFAAMLATESDSDQAAELLRQTHAALVASRELQEMERLQHMGLSNEKIAEVMEARLHENAHRRPQRHDSHTGVLEEIAQLAASRGIVMPTKQPLNTREGLMDPHPNFTTREMQTLKHGLLAFSKSQGDNRQLTMQQKLDEQAALAYGVGEGGPDSVGRAAAAQRVAELEAAGIIRVNRATPQAGTGAPSVVATPAIQETPRPSARGRTTAMRRYWATPHSGGTVISGGRTRAAGELRFEDVSPESASAAPRHPFSAGGVSVRDPDGDIPGESVYAGMTKVEQAAARGRLRGELSSRGVDVASNASYVNMLKRLGR